MQDNNFKNAVDDLVVGLGNELTKTQEIEYKDLNLVIDNLKKFQKNKKSGYYIEALPIGFISKLLVGKQFFNANSWKCKIEECVLTSKDVVLCKVSAYTPAMNPRCWWMYLATIVKEGNFINKSNALDKYLVPLTPQKISELLKKLKEKKKAYDKLYKEQTKEARSSINKELSKHVNDITVSRNAIRTAIKSIQKDTKVIADAWNSTLTKQEQETLLGWIAGNIYSMRLYVVQGSRWEKAISELYPEEQYGKARKTIPSECSKDSIGGYISLNNINNIPYDILKKITHKEKNEDIVKQNKGSSKYRINNYLLVLYLLNNYNQRGFKLAVTNLNKNITLR